MKRFYKEVTVVENQTLLDGKSARTPAGNKLALPNVGLAQAVAAEWRAQDPDILPRTMLLNALANTAIDWTDCVAVVSALTCFGAHDLLCYRSPDAELALREAAGWDPLLAWAADRYGVTFEVAIGIVPVAQHVAALGVALADYDDFTLAGLAIVVTATGSLVLGLALVEGRIDAATAFLLSRIDEVFQAEKWGADPEAEQCAASLERELAAAADFIALAR